MCAEVCNTKKTLARQASEESAALFFVLLVKVSSTHWGEGYFSVMHIYKCVCLFALSNDPFIRDLLTQETGPLREVGTVVAVFKYSFEVLLLSCGLTYRVNLRVSPVVGSAGDFPLHCMGLCVL